MTRGQGVPTEDFNTIHLRALLSFSLTTRVHMARRRLLILLVALLAGCTTIIQAEEYECTDVDTAWAAFDADGVEVFGSRQFKEANGWTCVWDDEILAVEIFGNDTPVVIALFVTYGLYLCTRDCI